MSAAARFPGFIYNEYLDPLSADAPEMTQAHLDAFTCKSCITEGDHCALSLIWVLDAGARFDDIPAEHVAMAIEELRRPDKSMLLLTSDPLAEESVREGLLDRLNLIEMPAGWMTRA